MKHRNAIARDLRTPKYRPRVVRNRKRYTRKGRPERRGQMTNGPSVPGSVCREAGIPDGINQEFAREVRAEKQRKQLEANALNYERVKKLAVQAANDKTDMERVRKAVRRRKRT